ncbi:hypothetical protein BKA93DRAFT_29317 [Sparassis latifolia]
MDERHTITPPPRRHPLHKDTCTTPAFGDGDVKLHRCSRCRYLYNSIDEKFHMKVCEHRIKPIHQPGIVEPAQITARATSQMVPTDNGATKATTAAAAGPSCGPTQQLWCQRDVFPDPDEDIMHVFWTNYQDEPDYAKLNDGSLLGTPDALDTSFRRRQAVPGLWKVKIPEKQARRKGTLWQCK